MKIAVVTDDGQTISAHFGRAKQFAVVNVATGKVVSQELRQKVGHREFIAETSGEAHHEHEFGRGHGHGEGARKRHGRMIAIISDCDIALARGMGAGMRRNLEEVGIRPILTDVEDIDTAIAQFLDGTLADHPGKCQ